MISFAEFGNQLYSGEKSFGFVKYRKVFIGVGLALILISGLLLGLRGLNPGVEFRGGAEFTITGISNADQNKAYTVTKANGLNEGVRVATLGTNALRIQTQTLTQDQAEKIRNGLIEAYKVKAADIDSTTIGPSWGKTVTIKAIWSLVIFLGVIAVILGIYFRTWKMSASALLALMHDITITVGFFALTQVEISPATVIGLLTILGYSLYDTVVVYDKIRELTTDFEGQRRRTYSELVNLAVNQTLVRSINTSVVALLPVASILFIGSYLLGAGTLRDISLALFVGTIIGTLSSIFIASPLLTLLREREIKIQNHNSRVAQFRQGQGAASDEILESAIGPVQVGAHQGQKAQPSRKARSRR